MRTIKYKPIVILFFCLFGMLQLRAENNLPTYVSPDTSFSYTYSIGGIIGPALFTIGGSFKTSLKENLFLQTDIYSNLNIVPYFKRTYSDDGNMSSFSTAYVYTSIESSTNIMYQKKKKETKEVLTYWFIGGGVNLGWSPDERVGKAAANAIIGFEYVFKKENYSMQIDFRPGYGLLFNVNSEQKEYNMLGIHAAKMPFSHFNYAFIFSLRRVFIKK